MPFKEGSSPQEEQNLTDPLAFSEYDLNQLELKKEKLKQMADAIHAKPKNRVTDKEIDAYTTLEGDIATREKILAEHGMLDMTERKKAA